MEQLHKGNQSNHDQAITIKAANIQSAVSGGVGNVEV